MQIIILTQVKDSVTWSVPAPALKLLVLSVLKSPVMKNYTNDALH